MSGIIRSASIVLLLTASACTDEPSSPTARVEQAVAAPKPLTTTVWIVGRPPVQEMLTLATARTADERARGLSGATKEGVDGMALVGSSNLGSADLDAGGRAVDVVAVSADGIVSKVTKHDGRGSVRIATPPGTTAILLLVGDLAKRYHVEKGTLVRMTPTVGG